MKTKNGSKCTVHPDPLSSPQRTPMVLLKLSGTAGFFKLLLNVFSFVLTSAFLDRAWSSVNNCLSFFEAETCDRANNLDHINFLLAR